MAVAYVLVEIEHQDGLDPNDILSWIEGGETIQSIKVIDVEIPNGRESIPYIGF
jgi:hypothetical protein